MPDHHSEYLTRAIDALTPEGLERVDELLEQLAEVVGEHEAVARFAAARKAEVDVGRTDAGESMERALSRQELDVLIPGFQSHPRSRAAGRRRGLGDAVVALLEDEAERSAAR